MIRWRQSGVSSNMDAESQVDWDEARRIVREWMAERKVNQSRNAKRGDLNRSVVNRFFQGPA